MEQLNEYLKDKVNFEIYEQLIKYNIQEKELFFNDLYHRFLMIKEDYSNPIKLFEEIKSELKKGDYSPDYQVIFLQSLSYLLKNSRLNDWQIEKLQDYLTEYSQSLQKKKNDLNNTERWNTFLKSTEKRNRLLKERLQEQTEELHEIIERHQKKTISTNYTPIFLLPNILPCAIDVMHQYLYPNFVQDELALFKLHFSADKIPDKRITWKAKKAELKAFIDVLLQKNILKPVKNSNQLIEQHFTSNKFKTDARSFGNVNQTPVYEKIVREKQTAHPIHQLVEEIKKACSKLHV